RQYEEAIIVGGGPTAELHFKAISEYILNKRNGEVCIIHASSRNAYLFKDLSVDQYFCLIGNEGQRLEKTFDKFDDTFNGKCILPPFPRKMGTYVPNIVQSLTYELEGLIIKQMPQDSPTVLAIELAIFLNCDILSIVGYDGYSDTSIGQK